ncbi:hypothetical protein JL36_06010 [Lactococcus cremoris]|nr:hypothetical protein JL36_06010 [Lactococcus cremoris]
MLKQQLWNRHNLNMLESRRGSCMLKIPNLEIQVKKPSEMKNALKLQILDYPQAQKQWLHSHTFGA